MPFVTCPQCKQSYAIDATNIGEESECECPCGNKFKVRLKAKSGQQSKPGQKTIPLGNSNSTISKTASCCRAFGALIAFFGFVATAASIASFENSSEREMVAFFILGGVGAAISSLPLFALAAIIEELVKIRQGIGKLTESLSNNGKQS